MSLHSPYTICWILWVSWFVIEECLALRNGGYKGTLSYHVWTVFAIDTCHNPPKQWVTPAWRLRRFLLASLMAWLSLHLLTGGTF